MSSEQAEREIVLRTRQDYENYNAVLQQQRSAIVDQNGDGAAVDAALQHIDRLYKEHVRDTHSSVVVHEDQQAFLHVSDLVLARAKNHVLGEPGAVSVDSFLGALREQVDAEGSGSQLLEQMSELFVRVAGTAVLPSSLPELSDAQRRKGHSGPRERPQSELTALQPADVTSDTAESDDREQQLAMQTIVKILSELERDNDYEPILLYELCLQQHSFAETMENLFLVSVLVSLGKLWLAPNKRGLPVVGTVQNRQEYLKTHEPERALSPERRGERQQYNFNMNYSLWLKLKSLYGGEDEESLIPPRRIRDAYDMQGRRVTGSSASSHVNSARSAASWNSK